MARRLLPIVGLLVLPCVATAQGRTSDLLRTNPRFQHAFRDVVAKVAPGVVRVRCDGSDTALGVVVSAEGQVLTKAHDLKEPIRCTLRDGRDLPARLIGADEPNDLALLQLEAKGLTALELIDSATTRAGSWVVSVGTDDGPIAIGVVSVPTRDVAASRKGVSDPAKSAYLGIGLASGEVGLRITDVVPDTAAVRAGLREGDVILRADGQPLREPEDFIEQLARRKPGDTILLLTQRNGEEREVRAKLQSRPTGPRIDMQNRMGSELSSRRSGYPVILQHDSVLTPNDCGGPLVDLQGRVIGINISRAGRVETWAIPAEVARSVLVRLRGSI